MPVKLKIGKLGQRMSKYLDRDLYDLLVGNQNKEGPIGGMRLRSNKCTSIVKWKGADKRDLGVMLFVAGMDYRDFEEKHKYIKGKFGVQNR